MNNPIVTIATWGLLFSGYIVIYKIVSEIFNAVSKHNESKRKEQEKLRHLEILKHDIMNLSNGEIAIIKFILKQSLHAAWLPDEDAFVILLESKNIIHNVDLTRTKIFNFWHNSNRNLSCNLYQITDNALKLITEMHGQLSQKWRNVKTDKTLADFQKL